MEQPISSQKEPTTKENLAEHADIVTIYFMPESKSVPLGKAVLIEHTGERRKSKGVEIAQRWICIFVSANENASSMLARRMKEGSLNMGIDVKFGAKGKFWVNVTDIPLTRLVLDTQIDAFPPDASKPNEHDFIDGETGEIKRIERNAHGPREKVFSDTVIQEAVCRALKISDKRKPNLGRKTNSEIMEFIKEQLRGGHGGFSADAIATGLQVRTKGGRSPQIQLCKGRHIETLVGSKVVDTVRKMFDIPEKPKVKK